MFLHWPSRPSTHLAMAVCGLDARFPLPVYWSEEPGHPDEITSQRSDRTGSLLHRKTTSKLFRIDHFDLHKPLGMRLVG